VSLCESVCCDYLASLEFLMKDAYSFDRDNAGLDESYRKMHEAYVKVFNRSGIQVVAVSADPGMMGGKVSHEFMVRTPYGEDRMVRCEACDYLASLEVAAFKIPEKPSSEKEKPIEKISTPNVKTIEALSKFLKIEPTQFLKAILYLADEKPVMVCLRGDHEVNEGKLRRFLEVSRLELASPDMIESATKGSFGFSGPVGLKGVKIVVDASACSGKNWIVGGQSKRYPS